MCVEGLSERTFLAGGAEGQSQLPPPRKSLPQLRVDFRVAVPFAGKSEAQFTPDGAAGAEASRYLEVSGGSFGSYWGRRCLPRQVWF